MRSICNESGISKKMSIKKTQRMTIYFPLKSEWMSSIMCVQLFECRRCDSSKKPVGGMDMFVEQLCWTTKLHSSSWITNTCSDVAGEIDERGLSLDLGRGSIIKTGFSVAASLCPQSVKHVWAGTKQALLFGLTNFWISMICFVTFILLQLCYI